MGVATIRYFVRPGGIYGTGCNLEGGGVRFSLGKITKIRAFPHPVPYKPPDPFCAAAGSMQSNRSI